MLQGGTDAVASSSARLGRRLGPALGLALLVALLNAVSAHADIYWGNFQSGFGSGLSSYIGHAKLNGSEANAEFLDVQLEHPARLAADSQYIYATFPGNKGSSIGRAKLDGTEHNPDFVTGHNGSELTPLDGAFGLVVTREYIYWTNYIGRIRDETGEGEEEGEEEVPAEIGRARIDGTEVIQNFITLPEGAEAIDLAAANGHLYWSGDDAIGRANINGSEVEPDFIQGHKGSNLGFVWALAVNREHIYWTHSEYNEETKEDEGQIGRAGVTGGDVEPSFIEGLEPSGTGAITLNGSHIYWTVQESEDTDGSIGRANLEGGEVNEDFIPDAGNPDGLTTDHRIVVNSAADYPAENPGEGICVTSHATGEVCTLRAAIEVVDADKSGTAPNVSFNITGVPSGQLATITLTKPLPEITSPVQIVASTQPGAFEAPDPYGGIPHKIGAILDGAGLPAGSNGLKLGPGAEGSILEGLQIQNFSGDGVLLEAEKAQLADSILYKDQIGAEVAASNVIVGSSEGREGDIFFRDGLLEGLPAYLKKLKPGTGLEEVDKNLRAIGAGIALAKPSSGTEILGDWIGIHGPGFEGADALPADGIKTISVESEPIMPIGIAVLPTSSPIRNVTISGSNGTSRDVISGTILGIDATPANGTAIEGLTINSPTVGPGLTGADTTGELGTVMGLLAGGNVSGLKLDGGNYSGDVVGALIAGLGVSSPIVEGATFGSGSVPPDFESQEKRTLGTGNVFGLLLGEVDDARIGGPEAPQANKLKADLVGLGLFGNETRRDTIQNNLIGDEVATFTTFLSSNLEFANVFGVLAVGNGCEGTKAAKSQELESTGNRFDGNTIAAFTLCTTGFKFSSNRFENSALGLFDIASGGLQFGTPGHGNTLTTDGIGVLQANYEFPSSDYSDAQVNPEDGTKSFRKKVLGANPDSEIAYDTVDGITNLSLSDTSTEPPSAQGSRNSYYGNRFGVNSEGKAAPDELPVAIGGDEHEVRFGGTGSGEGNTVEDNRDGGLWLVNFGAEHDPTVQILGNTIYNNENFTGSVTGIPGLGIDLVGEVPGFGFGSNNQDARQPDPTGPNNFQNSPVITSAAVASGTLTVEGTLHGVASTEYLIEVFADENPNPFGAGEGQKLLGRLSLITNSEGNVAFAAGFADPGAGYRVLSSTATTVPGPGLAGVTSEFSVDQPISRPGTTTTTGPTSTTTTTSTSKGAASTTVASSGSTATTSSSSVTLPAKASCSSATSTPCTVTTSATIPASAASATATAYLGSASEAKAKKPVVIGHASMTLAAGATAPLHFTLSKQGLALLRKHRTLSITVAVKISGKGRTTITRTLHFKLKYKKPAKKR